MFQSAIEGFCRAVGGVGALEVGQDVCGAPLEGAPQGDDLSEGGGNAAADDLDDVGQLGSPGLGVGIAVGGHDLLVDAPGGFHPDVSVLGEDALQAGALLVCEEIHPGVQGLAHPVQGVPGPASMPGGVLLDALAAVVQGIAGELDDVEGIHDLHRVGEFFLRCGLEPGEAVHGDHLNPVAPRRVLLAEPLLEGLLGAALHHVQQPGRTPSLAQRGEVDDHGDELVAPARVPPHVLVHPDRGHTLEAMLIVDEDPASLLQDGGVGAVPGHAQTLSDPGDGEVLDDDAFQGPTQSAPGQFRARLGRPSGVLPPHTPTPRTAVATHSHHQCHRSPARGLVGEATDHGVAGDPFAPTLATPPVIVHHPAGHLAAIREDSLAHHHEAEVIQAGERGQIGGSKGSVGHVGVFQMGSVGTPIIGRPRPSHPPRHASQTQPPATPRIAKSPITTTRERGVDLRSVTLRVVVDVTRIVPVRLKGALKLGEK